MAKNILKLRIHFKNIPKNHLGNTSQPLSKFSVRLILKYCSVSKTNEMSQHG